MKLMLTTGYPCPFNQLPDEGSRDLAAENCSSIFLTLEGIVHFEWKHTITVEFKTTELAQAAAKITGWKEWGKPYILQADYSEEEGYDHPAIVTNQPYGGCPQTAYCGFVLVE